MVDRPKPKRAPIIYAYSYVRISSVTQRKGDGLRRQTDGKTERWCVDNGYTLDTSLRLIPSIGKSGWTGEHRKPTAPLGLFLQAIKDGKVPVGSVLIVENLDRLSREDIDDALPLFLGILRAGVKIKTHDPDRLYTRADLKANPYAIIEPLVMFARANDESRAKSYRGKDRWERRRQQARSGERKATKTVPKWLELTEDRRGFRVLPDRAAIVRRIFADAIDGKGVFAIARSLNSEGVPNIGTAQGWNSVYIHKLLNGRAVLGEYQPNQKVDGKRVPIGPPIPDYFPAIIDADTYDRAQAALHHRRKVRGRPTPTINLFTGLLLDANDKQPMHIHKGDRKTIIVSSGAIRGLPGSVWRGYRYDHFERAFLRFVAALRPEDLIPTDVPHDEAGELAGQLRVIAHKIEVIQARIEAETTGDLGPLVEVLLRLAADRQRIKDRLDEIKRGRVVGTTETLGEAQSLVDVLDSAPPEELPALRSRLQARIRSLVRSIHLRIGDVPGPARMAICEVVFHDDSRRWLHMGYGLTKRRVEIYETGTQRLAAEAWMVTLA